MGDIYIAAIFIAIWLGEESDEVKMAFALLRKFSVAWDLLECDPPVSNDLDFISRNRAEKTLQAAFGENRPLESNAKVLGMSMLRAILLTRIAVLEKQLLLYLIVKTLEFRCADSRDHVFAMVGIASNADTFNLIDYETPIEKSFVYLTPLKRRLDNGGNMLMIRGRIVNRLKVLGSESRSLNDACIVQTLMNKKNLQWMLRQRYQWLEEYLAIAKTTSIANNEEAFQNALLGDFLVNKEVYQSLEVVRSEFSTQIRLYKAMAYENDYGRWLTAVMASMSLKSSHLLKSIIVKKLHRRFGRTKNGRIGWLPPIAMEGDFICVFDGMELPYAIRLAVDG
ncbi:hypothetical protein BKA65DRAFT_581482 [Rhexocercosporidium sp. MPI-PUGE-AT-0058]|nr:hypothetical protein BKA65DRAFT_581482 [Rhexocercosporidium sp. MPI-PUGE-AT-0058]